MVAKATTPLLSGVLVSSHFLFHSVVKLAQATKVFEAPWPHPSPAVLYVASCCACAFVERHKCRYCVADVILKARSRRRCFYICSYMEGQLPNSNLAVWFLFLKHSYLQPNPRLPALCGLLTLAPHYAGRANLTGYLHIFCFSLGRGSSIMRVSRPCLSRSCTAPPRFGAGSRKHRMTRLP